MGSNCNISRNSCLAVVILPNNSCLPVQPLAASRDKEWRAVLSPPLLHNWSGMSVAGVPPVEFLPEGVGGEERESAGMGKEQQMRVAAGDGWNQASVSNKVLLPSSFSLDLLQLHQFHWFCCPRLGTCFSPHPTLELKALSRIHTTQAHSIPIHPVGTTPTRAHPGDTQTTPL